MLLSRTLSDAVAADKGIEQTLSEPIVQIGDKVFALGLTPLHPHQITTVAGHDRHDNSTDGELFTAEHLVQLVDAVALMEQVVHQNDGTLEGFQSAHLVFELRIARIFLDLEAAQIGMEAFLHVEGLGHGIGHDLVREDLAVGHAHIGDEGALPFGHFPHPVHLLNPLQQRLIEHLRVKTQQQLAREHLIQCAAESGSGLHHRLPDSRLVMMGLFDAEHGILQQYHRCTHIHVEDVLFAGGHKAQLAYGAAQGSVLLRAAAQGIGGAFFQAAGQQLVEKHPDDLLRRLPRHLDPVDPQ